MLKLLWISILLTIIYSWEEFKRSIRALAYGLLKKNPPTYYLSRLDQYVGTLVMIATVPIGLLYFLASDQNLYLKLLWLAGGLLLVSVIASGSAIFARRLKIARENEGAQKIIPITYSILGFISPIFHIFSGVGVGQRAVLAKFAFLLSLPALVGLLAKYALSFSAGGLYLPNADALTMVLVGALIIRIVVEFLEYFFRLYRLERLFSYFRILLGVALAAMLAAGLL